MRRNNTPSDERVGQYDHIPLSDDPVKDYFRDIGKVPLLNAEQEVELSQRIEAGLYAEQLLADDKTALERFTLEELEWFALDGREAKQHMIRANLRLVVSVASRHSGRGMQLLDLIQEGNSGLIRAVEKFDHTKGFKFSTYATWWIRQAITRAFADQSRTIRIPVHMVERINKMGRVERQLEVELGRLPTPEELADELSVAVEEIVELKTYNQKIISLDQPIGDSDSGESILGDILVSDEGDVVEGEARAGLFREHLVALINSALPERMADILMMRHGMQGYKVHTLDEVGQVYGLTRERIRQIETQAIKSLKPHVVRAGLREFLD